MRRCVVLLKRWIGERLFAHLMRTAAWRATLNAAPWSMTVLMTRRPARAPRGQG